MASGMELAHLPSGMFSSLINGQEILEEEYNEDFEPTEEGWLLSNNSNIYFIGKNGAYLSGVLIYAVALRSQK